MANILFLSANPEMLEADHGGKQRSKNLLFALEKDHKVTALCLSWNKKSFVKQVSNNINLISIPVEAQVLRVYKANKSKFLNNTPDVAINVYSRYIKGYRAEMNRLAEKADLIVVDHYSIVPMIKYLKVDVPIFYSSHNCETHLATQMYPVDSLDVKTINEMERLILDKSSALCYCSTEDIKHINDYFILNKLSYYIPNGTDIPSDISPGKNYDKKDVFFIGSGHPPNWTAVKRIIEIAKKATDYNFIIAGTATYIVDQEKILLPPNVKKYSKISNEEAENLFSNAFAFINPIEIGSGTHLKIPKALSYGLPTITTSVGARGYTEKEKQESMIVVDSNDEMVEAIKSLSNKQKYESISKSAIQLSKKYNWKIIQEQFLNAINDVLKGKKNKAKPMQSKNILMYSIMRNEAGFIDQFHRQVKDFVESFPEHDFYLSIYENDSTDNTKEKLEEKDWSFFKDTSFIYETLNTKFYGSTKEEERVKNLSIARNKAIEAKDFLEKSDYVIMIESDVAYNLETAQKILRFTEDHPDADIVSGITIRGNRLYDVWATRSGPEYIKGVYPLHKDHYIKAFDKYYSTSNGICIYKSQPFKDGVRYGWINTVTKESDCDTVVICQNFHDAGYNNVYIIYDARIYHEHY